MIRLLFLLAPLAALLPLDAIAGCGDALVERVDWAEVKFADDGQPIDAKLHGVIGWEQSPDSWSTHPIGGTLKGFTHLGCSAGDTACSARLKAFTELAGTGKPLYFFGDYRSGKPGYAHAEDEASTAAVGPNWPGNPSVSGSALNQQLWPTVKAMAVNQPPAGVVPQGNVPEDRAEAPATGCAAAPGALLLALLVLCLRGWR